MDQIVQAPPPLPPAPPLPDSRARVSFTGDRSEFAGLAFKGGLLEIITFGFYRFWLATDIRRHLWSNTVVDGDSAEYTGRGLELFLGFLVAVAIMAPVYVGYFLLGLEAERMQAFASLPLALFFYLFIQFAIYRARRYRLTRTVWRGVRFGMGGSGWSYAFRAFGWALLVGVTFGLALPSRDASLERYKMRNSYYGDLRGSFDGEAWTFFKRAIWIWFLCLVVVIVLSVLPVALRSASTSAQPGVSFGLFFLLIIATPFLWAIFRAIQWRWWLEGLRFGPGVMLVSDLRPTRLIGLYWKIAGWSVLITLLFLTYLVFVLFMVVAGGSIDAITTDAAVIIARLNENLYMFYGVMLFGYAAFLVTSNLVMRLYFTRDLWQRVSESVTIRNIESANAEAAKDHVGNALGEGLLDGLDVGGL